MKKSLLFVCLLFCSPSIYAQFSGSGSGTEDDPYLITDGWELYDVLSDLSAHYKLMADIDMAAFLEEIDMEDEGWEPIGTKANPFTGTFDGNGKIITGLYINRPTMDNVGLFGYLKAATIKNIVLKDCSINANSYVGTLVGYGNEITFNNIVVHNTSVEAANNYAGGICGYCTEANISNLEIYDSKVIANSGVGGMFGAASGKSWTSLITSLKVSHIWVDGVSVVGGVTGRFSAYRYSDINIIEPIVNGEEMVGGFSGSCSSISYIQDVTVYNPLIRGNEKVGGIIGNWQPWAGVYANVEAMIRNSYVFGGIVEGGKYIGGIVGNYKLNSDSPPSKYTIKDCYSSSHLIGSGYIGGICGYPSKSLTATISDNRFDGRIANIGRGAGIIGEAIGSGSLSRNIVTGSVYAEGGICPQVSIKGTVTYNGCLLDTLSWNNKTPLRIGLAGTDNFASSKTVVISNGEEVEVNGSSTDANGVNKSLALLKRKTTYTSYGYDFDNTWAIVQGKTYPYNIKQCAPGEITSIEVGSTKVAGTAPADGKVYVFVGEKMYAGTITGGQWEVEIGLIKPGMEVRMSVETDNEKYPSVVVTAFAEKAHVNEETFTMASQYSTFCSTAAIDFSTLSDVKAYVAISMSDGKVKMKRVLDAPAGEGLLLKGTLGTYNLTKAQTSTKPTNMLVGVTTDTEVSPINGDYTNFILANGSSDIGFYTVSSTGVLTAGKAYLPILTTDIATSRGLIFEFDDSAISSIDDIPADRQVENVIYDLMGRKVSNESLGLSKGIYVIQGKKIIIK